MKQLNYNLIQIAIIVVLIIFIARICYLYSIFNKKHNLIGEILVTWKKKTSGGNIQKDIYKLYKDDYFLSRYLIHDDSTHIHLITHKDKYNLYEFMKILLFQYSDITTLKYIVKKNNTHSHLTQIHLDDHYDAVCNRMKTYLIYDI